MASKKISQLPAAAELTGAEIIPLVQGGVTKRVTVDDLPASAAGTLVQELDDTPRPDLKAVFVIDENGDIDDILIVEV